MAGTSKKFSQHHAGTLSGTRPLGVFRMSENADEAVFNQWASGPAIAAMFLEEGLHRLVVLVVEIRHRNQYINIK